MAVPKRKTSKARRDKRRASNIKIDAPILIECLNCNERIPQHQVCNYCGHYKKVEVIKMD